MRHPTNPLRIALVAMLSIGALAGTTQADEVTLPPVPDTEHVEVFAAQLTETGKALLANDPDLSAVPPEYCPIKSGPGKPGMPGERYTWCVYQTTMTGQIGVLCGTEEWAQGEGDPYYHGWQNCFLAMEDDASMICLGYSWEYHNDGGEKAGDKNGFSCDGLPIIAVVER